MIQCIWIWAAVCPGRRSLPRRPPGCCTFWRCSVYVSCTHDPWHNCGAQSLQSPLGHGSWPRGQRRTARAEMNSVVRSRDAPSAASASDPSRDLAGEVEHLEKTSQFEPKHPFSGMGLCCSLNGCVASGTRRKHHLQLMQPGANVGIANRSLEAADKSCGRLECQ